jgi:hypothetical protein
MCRAFTEGLHDNLLKLHPLPLLLQGHQVAAMASALHALVYAGLQLQPADLDSVLSTCLDGNQSSSGLTILGYVPRPCSRSTCRCLRCSLAITGRGRLVHCQSAHAWTELLIQLQREPE